MTTGRYKATLISMLDADLLDDNECRYLIGLVGEIIAGDQANPLNRAVAEVDQAPEPVPNKRRNLERKNIGPFMIHGVEYKTQRQIAEAYSLSPNKISTLLCNGYDLNEVLVDLNADDSQPMLLDSRKAGSIAVVRRPR